MPTWGHFVQGLRQDVGYAIRQLISKPIFSATAVVSVALGIGAITVIFTIVHAVLMDPFPYRSSERIGSIWLKDQSGQPYGLSYTPRQYLAIKQRAGAMEDAIAFKTSSSVLSEPGFPQIVTQDECTLNLFDFFGVPPLLGREFSQRDKTAGTIDPSIAVLGYNFWKRTFQGRRDVEGQHIRVNSKLYTVIGVLPERFAWSDADLYTPLEMRTTDTDLVSIVYRVRQGIPAHEISEEFEPLLLQFRREMPRWLYPEGPFHVEFVNIRTAVLGKFGNTLLALFGAVTVLLLIACSNVANLLLARAPAREAEVALRVALGASRGRLIRQMLTESTVLAIAGCVPGVLLARTATFGAVALLPPSLFPHEASITMNWPVLWFAIATTLLTGLAFGLLPALQLSKRQRLEAFRATGKGSVATRSRSRVQHLLIVAEISLSFTLLTGAAMAMRALVAFQHVSLGYDPRNVLTFFVPIEPGHYTQWITRNHYFEQLLARFEQLPQVQAVTASAIGTPPFSGGGPTKLILDRPDNRGRQATQISWNLVGSDYFKTLRTPLLSGRGLREADISQANRVAVITEDLARSYFPGQNPLGRSVELDLFNQPIPAGWIAAPRFHNSFEIVGVAATTRNRGLGLAPLPAIFLPYSLLSPPGMFVCIRAPFGSTQLVGQIRKIVREADRNQPITQVGSLEQSLRTAGASPRFATFVFAALGGVGMLLAVAGVFGVASWTTAQRTREFGIRMALGAPRAAVLRLVLKNMSTAVIAGLVLGFGFSATFGAVLSGRMEGMGALDPFILVCVPLTLAAAAMLACLAVAVSATRLQPWEALRHE